MNYFKNYFLLFAKSIKRLATSTLTLFLIIMMVAIYNIPQTVQIEYGIIASFLLSCYIYIMGKFIYDDVVKDIWKTKKEYILSVLGTKIGLFAITIVLELLLYLTFLIFYHINDPVIIKVSIEHALMENPIKTLIISIVLFYPLVYLLGKSLDQNTFKDAFISMITFFDITKLFRIIINKHYFLDMLEYISSMILIILLTIGIETIIEMILYPNVPTISPNYQTIQEKQIMLDNIYNYINMSFFSLIFVIFTINLYNETKEYIEENEENKEVKK